MGSLRLPRNRVAHSESWCLVLYASPQGCPPGREGTLPLNSKLHKHSYVARGSQRPEGARENELRWSGQPVKLERIPMELLIPLGREPRNARDP